VHRRPFDFDGALDKLGGDHELLRDALRLFIETAPVSLTQIREDAARGAAPAVQCTAHGLKGAAAKVGATAMSATALNLERLAETGELRGAVQLLDQLEAAYHQLAVAAKAMFP
jgi:HPt (histidine-containing phosphotransfer) domain-containing protein